MFTKNMSRNIIFLVLSTLMIANVSLANPSRFRPLNSGLCYETEKCEFESVTDLLLNFHDQVQDPSGANLNRRILVCLFGNFNCPYVRNDFNSQNGNVLTTIEPNSGINIGLGLDLSRIASQAVANSYGLNSTNVPKINVLSTLFVANTTTTETNTTQNEIFFTYLSNQTGNEAYVLGDSEVVALNNLVINYFFEDLRVAYEEVVEGQTAKKLADLPIYIRTVLFALNYNIGMVTLKATYPDLWKLVQTGDWVKLAKYLEQSTTYPQSQWQRLLYKTVLLADSYTTAKSDANADSFSNKNLLYALDLTPYSLANRTAGECFFNATDANSSLTYCKYMNNLQKNMAESIDLLVKTRTDIVKVGLSVYCGANQMHLGHLDVNNTAVVILSKLGETLKNSTVLDCAKLPDASQSLLYYAKLAHDINYFPETPVLVFHTDLSIVHQTTPVFSSIHYYSFEGVNFIGNVVFSELDISKNNAWVMQVSLLSGVNNLIYNMDYTNVQSKNIYNVLANTKNRLANNKSFPVKANQVNSAFSGLRTRGNSGIVTLLFDEATFNQTKYEYFVSNWNPILDANYATATPITSFRTNFTVAPSVANNSPYFDEEYVYLRVVSRSNITANYEVVYAECKADVCPTYVPVAAYVHTNTSTVEGDLPLKELFPDHPVAPVVDEPVSGFGSVTFFIIILIIALLTLLGAVLSFIRCRKATSEHDRNSETILRKI